MVMVGKEEEDEDEEAGAVREMDMAKEVCHTIGGRMK